MVSLYANKFYQKLRIYSIFHVQMPSNKWKGPLVSFHMFSNTNHDETRSILLLLFPQLFIINQTKQKERERSWDHTLNTCKGIQGNEKQRERERIKTSHRSNIEIKLHFHSHSHSQTLICPCPLSTQTLHPLTTPFSSSYYLFFLPSFLSSYQITTFAATPTLGMFSDTKIALFTIIVIWDMLI